MGLRLIDTDTLHLRSFWETSIPRYAILSHTWGNEEISFQEMITVGKELHHSVTQKAGYMKIVNACRKAKSDGLSYIWVDTCCIDKSSSSELSEAINSMYRWYRNAEVCYVFLSDFEAQRTFDERCFRDCRWFTRGWCLQELIAPRHIEFFDVRWNPLGSKSTLAALIASITRIDEEVLLNSDLAGSVAIARRMSWAAKRETTRAEDMAYCLLGILDVNMPMLYGEGPKAFIRLQEEIIRTSNDLSIFAFPPKSTNEALGPSQSYCDLLASSPADFMTCGSLENKGMDVHWNNAFSVANKGLYFQKVELLIDDLHGLYRIPLNCQFSKSKPAMLSLRKVGPSLYARYDDRHIRQSSNELDAHSRQSYRTQTEQEVYIIQRISPSIETQLGRAQDHAIAVRSRSHDWNDALQVFQRAASSTRWDAPRMQFLTQGEKSFRGSWKVFPGRARRISQGEGGNITTTDHFYLICGLDHDENSSQPQAWTRLCSFAEWKNLTNKLGIVTNLDLEGPPDSVASTEMVLSGTNSSRVVKVTAAMKPGAKEGRPCYILEINMEVSYRLEQYPELPSTFANIN